tara:strand:+ start:654 stop:1025 length:372 start_codon:yes stop_codon:yes gene_type:complete
MSTSSSSKTNSEAVSTDLKPEQALGLIGMGLVQKMSRDGIENWNWTVDGNNEKADLISLRQRLELISLALETGAPLSTSEVSHLLGIRPGSGKTERGGLVARRISRNVWKLNKIDKDNSYWRN